MANKEFYLQLFIIETFKENGTKFFKCRNPRGRNKRNSKKIFKKWNF